MEKEEVRKEVKQALDDLFKSHLGGEASDPDTIVKHAGQFNLKKLLEEHGTLSVSGQRQSDLWFNKLFSDTLSHVERLRAYEETLINDLITHKKNVDARTLLHVPTHDFAFSRTWTFIDELVASLMAKTGLQQDVVADLLVKVLADVIEPKIKETTKTKDT